MGTLRLTPAEVRALALPDRPAPRARAARPRAARRLTATDTGHTWHREGRGVRCQQCTMWLPLWALPDWGHGQWQEALTNRPVSDEKVSRKHERGERGFAP